MRFIEAELVWKKDEELFYFGRYNPASGDSRRGIAPRIRISASATDAEIWQKFFQYWPEIRSIKNSLNLAIHYPCNCEWCK